MTTVIDDNPHNRHTRLKIDYLNIDQKVCVSTARLSKIAPTYLPGPPLVFETMIFGGIWHGYQERHASSEAALARHESLLTELRNGHFPSR